MWTVVLISPPRNLLMQQNLINITGEIQNLIAAASLALAVDDQEIEKFLAAIAPYLNSFDSLNASFQPDVFVQASTEQREAVQQLLLELDALHKKVLSRAEANKEIVSEVISDIHKRSSAMKRYVDTFPQRVSITKKKEG